MPKITTEDGEILDVVTNEVIARTPPFFKTPYNHDTDAESLATALDCKDPSKTQQQFAKDADINNILAKFLQTGELNQVATPKYQDLETEFDLQDQMVTAYQVEQAWNQLPKAARAILKTPDQFVAWYDKCLEEGNIEGLREIGLVPPEKAPEPRKDPPTPSGGSPAPEPGEKAPPAP